MSSLKPVLLDQQIALCDTELPASWQFYPHKSKKLYDSRVSSISFSPVNDQLFVSLSGGGSLKMINADTLEERWGMEDHTEDTCTVCVSSDGTKAMSGAQGGEMIVSDMYSGIMLNKFYCASTVLCAAFFSDGKRVICGNTKNAFLELWNIETTQREKTFLVPEEVQIYSCSVSPDDKFIAAGNDTGSIYIWNSYSQKREWTRKHHTEPVYCLFFSSMGGKLKLLSGSGDGTMVLWDMIGKEAIRIFEGHTGKICACVLSKNEKVVFSVSSDRTFRIWDVFTGNCYQTIQFEAYPECFSLSKDECNIAIGLEDGDVSVLKRIPGSIVSFISTPSKPVSVSLSLDQSVIVVAVFEHLRRKVLIMDVSSDAILHSFFVEDIPLFCNISLNLHKNNIVTKNVTLQQYALRCLIVSRILLFSPDSLFANRFKLSVWLILDIFADAVVHHSIGMSFAIAKRIVSLSLSNDSFPLPWCLSQKNDFFRFVEIYSNENRICFY